MKGCSNLSNITASSSGVSSPEGSPTLLWEKKGLIVKDRECPSVFAKAFLNH